MADTVELKGRISLEKSAFETGLAHVASAAAKTGQKMGSYFSGIGKNFLSGISTGPIIAIGNALASALDPSKIAAGIVAVEKAGASLYLLGKQTGGDLGTLEQLRGAFAAAGQDSDELGMAINRLEHRSIGANSALQDLGINLDAMSDTSPDKQFVAVGQAIAAIPNPVQRADAAISIFGRSGAKLQAVFESDAFKNVGGPLSAKAKVMSESAEEFYKTSVALTKAGKLSSGFYVGAAGGLGGNLLPALNKINSIDLVGIGQGFGKGIAGGALALDGVLKLAGKLPKLAESIGGGGGAKGSKDSTSSRLAQAATMTAIQASPIGPMYTAGMVLAAAAGGMSGQGGKETKKLGESMVKIPGIPDDPNAPGNGGTGAYAPTFTGQGMNFMGKGLQGFGNTSLQTGGILTGDATTAYGSTSVGSVNFGAAATRTNPAAMGANMANSATAMNQNKQGGGKSDGDMLKLLEQIAASSDATAKAWEG